MEKGVHVDEKGRGKFQGQQKLKSKIGRVRIGLSQEEEKNISGRGIRLLTDRWTLERNG
jgi:hypothetical protein